MKWTRLLSESWIEERTFRLFLALQKNPLLPVSALAEQFGVSSTLVKSRLQAMKENGFLRKDSEIIVPFLGKRLQTEVEAVYNPFALGLQRVHVIFENIKSKESLQWIQALLRIHPYSHYQVVGYSGKAYVYSQIDIPPEGLSYLKDLLNLVKNEGHCSSLKLMTQRYIARSDFDFDLWKSRWSTQGMSDSWNEYVQHSESTVADPLVPQTTIKFDITDLKLLRELTVNGRPIISQLSKYYDIDRSRISRRVNRLREKVITENRLYFNRNIFNLSYPQVIVGRFTKEFTPAKLSGLLRRSVPFRTTAYMGDKSFVWYMQIPPGAASNFSEFVWENALSPQYLQLDLERSERYYFYHGNMESRGRWRYSRSYILDEPLENMKEIL